MNFAIARRLARMLSKGRKKKLRFHESTQRALCRLVFFWLALLPALSVAGYSVLIATPWYQSDQKERWQRRLSENLGVDVRFQSIEFPSPHKFRADDLVCFNPETGREILKIAKIQASMDRSGWLVEVESPILNGDQLHNAMQVVHDRYLCRPQSSACLLGLLMPELLISDAASVTKLRNVNVGFKPTESASKLMVSYSIEETQFPSLASFSVERDHLAESTHWTINTKTAATSCKVLSELFPSLKHLGEQAVFLGTIEGSQNNQHWKTSVRGDFYSIDLGKASLPFGQPLQGLGKLHKVNAEFSDGSLRSVQGQVSSNSCFVDTDWLDQKFDSRVLNSTDSNPWKEMGPRVSVNRLGLEFVMDLEQGVKFTGATPPPADQTNWPRLAAYIGNKPIACTNSAILPINSLTTALTLYQKPDAEIQPTRIARARE